MPKTNAELAAILQEMAHLQEILGANRFKVIALQKAARTAEDHPTPLASLPTAELLDIDGIGKGVAGRITEWAETGDIQERKDLLAKIPTGLPALLSVSGLGPKTVQLLWKEADITSIEDLKQALEDDQKSAEVAAIKGLGEKKLQAIRKNLAFLDCSAGRVRLGTAMTLAKAVLEAVKGFEHVDEAVYAGSLRRGKETIGDIDILVRTDADEPKRKKMAKAFNRLDLVTEILAEGATKASARMQSHPDGPEIQVDLRMVPSTSFGAALMYFTGSKEHNVRLRARAQDRGLSLNEYGLWKGKAPQQGQGDTKQLVTGAAEEDVFAALDLAYVPPERREDRGEIDQAQKAFESKNRKLPKLIEQADILADLHTHTTASDGSLSIDEMAEAAIARGLKILAITDHSKSQVQARGLSEERIREHIQAVREANSRFGRKITLLAGSEVDILADGSLDYPDDLLAELDIVVASPHAALSQDPDTATARLIAAIEHPHVHIIGHPTGRLINRREGLSPDITAIIDAAEAHGVALEINANHYRLDLRDTHATLAIEAGVPLAINTDAHSQQDFNQLQYGILTARRAGATANDVLNAWKPRKVLDWLGSHKK
ncbi:DNA polymerase/3'-5' exonuclease PolX [Mucisphaera sp.]|uniref:DNA polymerase/3'-5' exonuclease PolX n=1 Tax=Mucisphaera sp. TaxID=2913024 RepID=UPI003D13237A